MQAGALALLSNVAEYDHARGRLTTWIKPVVTAAAQTLAGTSHLGVNFTRAELGKVSRFSKALYDGQQEQWSTEALQQLASAVLRKHVGIGLLLALMRCQDEMLFLSECHPEAVANAKLIGVTASTRCELGDDDILEIFERESVANALSHLTPKQADHIADMVGLGERPADVQRAVAKRLGLTRSAVANALYRGRRRVKNGVAAAELGALTIVSTKGRKLKPGARRNSKRIDVPRKLPAPQALTDR